MLDLKKHVIKLKIKKDPSDEDPKREEPQIVTHFKDYVYDKIKSKINGDLMGNGCTEWLGYADKHRNYSVACHMVYFKKGSKHFLNPQKYIYNYLNSPDATYSELIKMKNRVRNTDQCKNRGLCCCLSHIEIY